MLDLYGYLAGLLGVLVPYHLGLFWKMAITDVQLRLRVVSDGPPEMSQISVDAEREVPISVSTPATPSGEAVQPEQGPNQPAATNSAPKNSRSLDTQPTDNRNPSQPTDTHIHRYPLLQRKSRNHFKPGIN